MYACTSSSGTPSPVAYMFPRLTCALASPWSAARRYQRTASASSWRDTLTGGVADTDQGGGKGDDACVHGGKALSEWTLVARLGMLQRSLRFEIHPPGPEGGLDRIRTEVGAALQCHGCQETGLIVGASGTQNKRQMTSTRCTSHRAQAAANYR